MALLQSNYCTQWNISVTVIWWWKWWISDQNTDFEVTENDSFENMVEIANMSQVLNVAYWGAKLRSALPQYPYKFQKVTKYALFYSFVIVIEIQVHLNKLECRGKVHLFQ